MRHPMSNVSVAVTVERKAMRQATSILHNNNIRIVWFKPTDLRLHDHLPLLEAHSLAIKEGSAVVHLLTLDSKWYGKNVKSREAGLPRVGFLRKKFLLESINDLQKNLQKLGHRLMIYDGDSKEAFSQLSRFYDVQGVHAYGPELCSEEQTVEASVSKAINMPLVTSWGWTLHHIDDLPKWVHRGRKIPGRYKPFLQAVQRGKKSFLARRALPAPTHQNMSSENLDTPLEEFLKMVNDNQRSAWGVHILKDCLVNCPDCEAWSGDIPKGGETAAINFLTTYVWIENRLSTYVGSSDSMSPGKNNALNSTTGLSPYIALGCLSPRLLYDTVQEYEQKRKRNRSTYWVFHELVFRDYFAFSCIKWKNSMFQLAGPLDCTGHSWMTNQEEARWRFRRWCNGKTGYPLIDAGLRQLKVEGKMPHLLRQASAGFLVRDLRVDWRWGAEWFESRLLDYTPDANWGNWGYRILPVRQIQPLVEAHLTSLEILSWPIVHDPHLQYILKWVPELAPLAKLGDLVKVREPWRLAKGYKRLERINVAPCKDSPLWIMSVNRKSWPDYEQMMTGFAYTVSFEPASPDSINEDVCPLYPPPMVKPVELEIDYARIPVDHSWGSHQGNNTNNPTLYKKKRKKKKQKKKN
jgi:deoxyribodipyrimidine photo-lyase